MIFNGGDPLDDCPKSWDEARKWEDFANKGIDVDFEPQWGFDCGYKLDYDGPILYACSRFYPPKTHYGPKWDGTVVIYLMAKTLTEKKFKCESLGSLKQEVSEYINSFVAKLKTVLLPMTDVTERPGSMFCDRTGPVTIEDCKTCWGTGGCRYGKTEEEWNALVASKTLGD